MIQREILVKSTLDDSLQPSLFNRASRKGRPLLVGLHTWSYDRFNQIDMQSAMHLLLSQYESKEAIQVTG